MNTLFLKSIISEKNKVEVSAAIISEAKPLRGYLRLLQILKKIFLGIMTHENGGFLAGHSKWANIKHRKEQDAIRESFHKIDKEITVSPLGGADINSNPRLRSAVEAANNSNMPKIKSNAL